MRRADGAYRWVDGRGEPLRDQSGAIVHWYAISIDIDDQMRLYSDIEEREAKIRRLVDSDIIGIVIWDLDGRLIDANDAFLRMVQYDREDLQAGLRWFDMTPPEWQEVHAREEAEELSDDGQDASPREGVFQEGWQPGACADRGCLLRGAVQARGRLHSRFDRTQACGSGTDARRRGAATSLRRARQGDTGR